MTATPRRTTRQRSAVTALLARQDGFRSAQHLYDQLRAQQARVSLATVYRALQAMAHDGEVDTVRGADGEIQYRMCSTSDHHHHLVCRRCGAAVEVSGSAVERWASSISAKHGYRQEHHVVELSGICPGCALTADPELKP